MAFHFENLDYITRIYMVKEFILDLENNTVYYSNLLKQEGLKHFPKLLLDAIKTGNDQVLGLNLSIYLKEKEEKIQEDGSKKIVPIKKDTNQLIAEMEFNKYYIRGLCRRAIETKITEELEVYRARELKSNAQSSEKIIGQTVNPESILEKLRDTDFIFDKQKNNTFFQPYTGLSLRIKQKVQSF